MLQNVGNICTRPLLNGNKLWRMLLRFNDSLGELFLPHFLPNKSLVSCNMINYSIPIKSQFFIFPHFPCRDAEDTKLWINEKDIPLSSTDYGHDLASVQALQRKHEAIERDLAALEEKV